MKRFLGIFVILILLSVFPASAAGTVSFETGSITCKDNRVIAVNVNAQGEGKLSAAIFEFYFDKSVLEFRGTDSPDGTLTEHTETENGVRVCFLCADGKPLSGKNALFSLSFKSVAEGESEIGFTVKDCADSDAQWMRVGSCTAGTVNVSSRADDSAGTAETKQPKKQSDASSAENKGSSKNSTSKSDGEEDQQLTEKPTIHDLGTLNSVEETAPDSFTPIIVLCASAAVAAAVIGFIIYQIKSKKKNDSSDD